VRVALFALLVFPLALSSAFPAFARWVAGPRIHVCHCEASHSTCACPICHGEDDDTCRLSEASIRGKCGDDDLAFGGALGMAVLPAGVSGFAPAALVAAVPELVTPAVPSRDRAPPVPPPRV
jgi:hypothetical protein